MVVSTAAFQAITEDETKPEPVTSRGVSPDPASKLEGLMLLIAGTGLSTEKLTAGDVPPPGEGFTTVTFAIDALARSAAGMVALKVVAEPNVVAKDVPFH